MKSFENSLTKVLNEKESEKFIHFEVYTQGGFIDNGNFIGNYIIPSADKKAIEARDEMINVVKGLVYNRLLNYTNEYPSLKTDTIDFFEKATKDLSFNESFLSPKYRGYGTIEVRTYPIKNYAQVVVKPPYLEEELLGEVELHVGELKINYYPAIDTTVVSLQEYEYGDRAPVKTFRGRQLHLLNIANALLVP